MEIFAISDLMCRLDSQIKIFEANKKDGIMSRNKIFYDENFTQDDINEIFKETRIKLGEKHGFNGLRMIQASQKTETNNVKYPDGKYISIKDKILTTDDYWYLNLEADILMINNKYKGIVIGNMCADCPIVIAEDRKKGVTALAHCGAAYIDRNLPYQIIESLKKEYSSNSEDIYVYISSGAKKENFIYDTYPHWAKNDDVWIGCIDKKDNKYVVKDYGILKCIPNDITEINNVNIVISNNLEYKDYGYNGINICIVDNSGKKYPIHLINTKNFIEYVLENNDDEKLLKKFINDYEEEIKAQYKKLIDNNPCLELT